MARGVKTRSYVSESRARQALATRRRIMRAAFKLFAKKGYEHTTIAQIAEAAQVAVATIYKGFDNKPTILRALVDTEMTGDPAGGEVMSQPWWLEQLEEPDAARQLTLIARNAREIYGRAGRLLQVVRQGAVTDGEVAALWERVDGARARRSDVTASSLVAKDGTRPELEERAIADVLWTLTHPDVYFLFVFERRWAPPAYEEWLTQALVSALMVQRAST